MSETPPTDSPPELTKDWHFYLGMTALILAMALPLFALAVPLLGLPAAESVVIVGLMIAGGPEVLTLIAVALLGKQTLHYFLSKAKGAVLKALLVKPVSKTRYYLGLAISVASMMPLYLYGYVPDVMPVGNVRIYILASSDLIFILSIFIMGGEFWEKFRRLFIWEGVA